MAKYDSLYQKLMQYVAMDYYPFHMPGHKRNVRADFLPYAIDITEIDGFDNLHCAGGVLQQCMRRAAKLYHAKRTFFLVNGSTAGLLTAISAAADGRTGAVIMARNSHKAAFHAAFINRLSVEYVYPQKYIKNDVILQGSVAPQDIRHILENKSDILAVVITSPTYDGVVSDVASIAKITRQYNVPLIVDEAHGAHFGFHRQFPQSAVSCGADVVIHSLHKTLPSMTQTALLHVNGPFISERKIEQYESVFQTSSPSYVMMASMDECLRLLEQKGAHCFDAYYQLLNAFQQAFFADGVSKLTHLKILAAAEPTSALFGKDISKILIFTGDSQKSGKWLYQKLLHDYHLQMEMAAGNYVLAMTSIMDTEQGFARLRRALLEIDRELTAAPLTAQFHYSLPRAEIKYDIFQANARAGRFVRISESAGSVSKEYAYLYPPGSPLLVPGEYISQETIALLANYKERGFSIEGLQDKNADEIEVIK